MATRTRFDPLHEAVDAVVGAERDLQRMRDRASRPDEWLQAQATHKEALAAAAVAVSESFARGGRITWTPDDFDDAREYIADLELANQALRGALAEWAGRQRDEKSGAFVGDIVEGEGLAEWLESLPVHAVVVDADGLAWQRFAEWRCALRYDYNPNNRRQPAHAMERATLIYLPEVAQ